MPCKICGRDLKGRKSKKCRDCIKDRDAVNQSWDKISRGGGVTSCIVCGYATTKQKFKMYGGTIPTCEKCFARCTEMGHEKYVEFISDEKMAEDTLSRVVIVGKDSEPHWNKIREALSVVICRHDWDVVQGMKKAVVVPYEIAEHGVKYRTYDIINWDRTEDPEEMYNLLGFNRRWEVRQGKKKTAGVIRGNDLLTFYPPSSHQSE